MTLVFVVKLYASAKASVWPACQTEMRMVRSACMFLRQSLWSWKADVGLGRILRPRTDPIGTGTCEAETSECTN